MVNNFFKRSETPPKRSLRFAFIISTFFVLSITGIIMGGVTYVVALYKPFGPKPIVPIVLIVLVSIVLGAFFFGMVSKIILKPVDEITEATKAVSTGDFTVRLNETQRIQEMQAIFKNFNFMVQELSSIETLREDFVVNISHEFKTPIAAIEGGATLLQDEHLSKNERIEFTRMILDSTKQLTSLIENILRISKLESTEIPIEKKFFNWMNN